MACFADDLQSSSLVVHQAKIHYIVYDDSWSKTNRKWYWCLSCSLDWRLEKLWVHEIDVNDGNLQQTFKLRAMIFCTINDFPAYGNLSGYSVKGHHACPICEKDTSYIQLKHGKKTMYTRHQRFLKPYHPYWQMKKAFNGTLAIDNAPNPLCGHKFFDRVKDIITMFGKTQKKDRSNRKILKKRSIFGQGIPTWGL